MRKSSFSNILKRLSRKLIAGGLAIGTAMGFAGDAAAQNGNQFVPTNFQQNAANQGFQAPINRASNQPNSPQFTSPSRQPDAQRPRIQPLESRGLETTPSYTTNQVRGNNTPIFRPAKPENTGAQAILRQSSAPVFRSYPLNKANLNTVSKQIKLQLGNAVEIVSDATNNRMVIKASEANHQMISQVVKRFESPSQRTEEGADVKSIRSFNVSSEVIRKAANELSQLYVDKNRVIVAADETVGKLMVFSTERDYEEVAAYLKRQGFLDAKASAKSGQPGVQKHQLKHIGWRELEQSIYRSWGNEIKIEVSTDGAFSRFQIPTLNQSRSTIQIDRRNNLVQIDAANSQLSPISRLVSLIDQPAGGKKVSIVKTRPDAIDHVQSTVSMYKFAALQQEVQPKVTSAILGKSRPNNGIYAIYQDQDQDNNNNANNNRRIQDNQLGPVGRVEIIHIPGTDIIILRGDPEDVARVRELIERVEQTSEDYQSNVEVLPLKHVDNIAVQAIATEVYTNFYAPKLGDIAITALVKPNAILLVGPKAGVDQARILIKRLDVPVEPQTEFKVFRIKHMSAVDLENRLRAFYLGQSTQGFGANVGGGGGQNNAVQGIAGDGLAARMRLASDYRSNALFVHASPRDMEEITKFVTEIDVESAPDGAVDHLKIIRLKNSTAAELAPVLQDILTGQLQGAGQSTQGNNQFGNQFNNLNNQQFSQVRSAMLTLQSLDPSGKIVRSSILFDTRITADENSNSLIIKAPKDSIPLIELLVQQLDQLPDVESRIKVYELENAAAPQVVETIQNLFETQQGGGGGAGGGGAGGTNILPLETGGYDSTIVSLRLAADARSNTVIAAGSQGDLNIIEALIARLDEDIDSDYVHKVYRLQNVTADIVAEAITGWLEGRSETLGTDPRVVGSGDGSLEAVKRAITVQSETESNSLIVSAHREYLDIIENIIRDLDFKKQVVIQAVIAEVQLEDNFELGVQWGVQDSLLFDRGIGVAEPLGFPFVTDALGNTVGAGTLGLASREDLAGQALSNLNVGRTSTNAGYAGLVLSAGNESINVLLRALDSRSRVDILSRPQITTLENIQAFVQVGQDLPYVTGTNDSNNAAGTTTLETDFLELGVTLSVTPRVRPDGEIWMRVDVGNTSVAEGNGVVVQISANGGEVRQPIVNVQTLQTDIVARSGQTIVLGGLIEKRTEEFTNGVPFFSNIPLLGRLFRFDSTETNRRELFVIMRPIVLDSPEDRDMLMQVESNRMNWVLSDITEIHGPVFEDEVLAGDVDTVYPDRTPTGYHQEADADNRQSAPDSIKTGSLAPLNGDLSRANPIRPNQMPLPNERFIPQSNATINQQRTWVQQSSYQQDATRQPISSRQQNVTRQQNQNYFNGNK